MEKKTDREKQLESLYRAGNFAMARPLASSILADTAIKETERETAARLQKAMATDPAATIVFAVTLFALVFITLHHLL